VLTKGAVRKIATKVLTKRAGRLSVAHAETATTATTLDSFTAAQLLTTGYRFALPSEPTASTRDYTFPGVPAGT
jgi:hypothetical protein